MFRKFCSSAVYSSTPHVLILTALTCGYNQQVITCKVCSFSQEQRDCILDFPFPYPRTRMIQIIPHPMVQRVMLVQWVFKGWALRKGDGSKWIEPYVPMIHLFWETKRPLLFTVIIAFLAGIWREWVQVREWHSRGRRKKTFHPFVLITFVSLFLDLYSSPSNACHTDISIWEYMCFEYPILVLKSLLLIRKPKH